MRREAARGNGKEMLMGFLSKFEGKMEDTVEGAAEKMGGSSITPVQIAKKAEKQMRREKVPGPGKQLAPTLYTVLVSAEDDERLFGYYPTLAGETETYLAAKAAEYGYAMECQPLVRFIADDSRKRGKFDVVAEVVAKHYIDDLRAEEMERYGIAPQPQPRGRRGGYAEPAGRGRDPRYAAQRDDYGYDDGYGYAPAAAAGNAARRAAQAAPAAGAEEFGAAAGGYAEAPKTMVFGQAESFDDEPPAAEDDGLQAYIYDITNDRAFTLTGRPMSIGRESRNDIVIPDINASRSHAEIRRDPSGAWILSDLGSTNGTIVNNRQIKSAPLRDADRIIIGTTELEFQLI